MGCFQDSTHCLNLFNLPVAFSAVSQSQVIMLKTPSVAFNYRSDISEKIELGVPDVAGYLKLIPRFLGRTPLADGFEIVELAEQIRGMVPADLEAVTNTAKRMALNRAGLEAKQVPPLIRSDFEEAIKRNRGVVWRSPNDV